MNYYEHHLGDYVKDAGHLSMVEDGAYRRLIDAYYIKEAPIPLDLGKACRLARAIEPEERAAVESVLNEFFEKTEDGWMHSRCDAEIAKYLDKQAAEPAKKQNDRDRQARARERRRTMFEFLREHGVTAPWDATTEQLQAAIDRVKSGDVTGTVTPESKAGHSSDHAPVTQPVTRDNTATQTPDPSTHSSGATAPARPAAEHPQYLPVDDLLPEDLDRYGMPGRQTVEQMECELWDAGKALLMRANVPKQQAGSFIGGLIAKWNDRQMVIEVVRAAIVERPADPKGWMTAACQTRAGARRTSVSNLTERRVSTMAGLKNTGAQHGNSTRARDGGVVDAEARVVNGN